MLKVKLLQKQKESLEMKLSEAEKSEKELTERAKELEAKVDSATTEEELDEVEKEVSENEEKISELQKEKKELQEKIKEIENAIDELQRKSPKLNIEGEKREMKKTEQRKQAEEYIRSRGTLRENKLTSTELGVLIPKEISNTPTEEKGRLIDLSKFVTVVKVNTSSGTYPLLKRTKAVLATAEELAKNPDLAKPEFEKVDWKVATYRGAIPISQESIDDAEVDVLGIVEKQAEILKINTKNKKICEVLKTFEAKTFTKIDEVITLLDVDLDIAYSRIAIMSQTFFNKLHLTKDKMGRYMWDTNLIANSQNEYIPVEIVIVPDEYLGEKSEAKAFIGDSEAGVLLSDRADLSVKWIDNEIYGQYLQAAIRFDAKKADTKAGFFVTLNIVEA